MLQRVPKFTRHEIPQLDELELDMPVSYPDTCTDILGRMARQNIALQSEIMGTDTVMNTSIPTSGLLRSDQIILRRTDDYYAVSLLKQHARLSPRGPNQDCRWDSLYYADPSLAYMAQADISIPYTSPHQHNLLSTLGSVSLQRFMTVADHQHARSLLAQVEP